MLLVLLVISSSLFVGFDRGEDLTIALPPPPVEEEAPLMSAYDFIVLNNVNTLALLTVTEMEDGMSAVVKRINLRHVTDVAYSLTMIIIIIMIIIVHFQKLLLQLTMQHTT